MVANGILGRTGVLDAGPYRGSTILAKTNLDIRIHASMDFHLSVRAAIDGYSLSQS
jgi:hypothetical protein